MRDLRQRTAVLDKNGNGKDQVRSRWTQHLKDVLNKEEPENLITSDKDCGFELSDIINDVVVYDSTDR